MRYETGSILTSTIRTTRMMNIAIESNSSTYIHGLV
ncbi:hypothetical protein Syn7502_00329 [Synechococcus sp. PCC 7502]|nr:hypothetical protein Syn7502_00329 [Synechococcus sp. PCC 7502]